MSKNPLFLAILSIFWKDYCSVASFFIIEGDNSYQLTTYIWALINYVQNPNPLVPYWANGLSECQKSIIFAILNTFWKDNCSAASFFIKEGAKS